MHRSYCSLSPIIASFSMLLVATAARSQEIVEKHDIPDFIFSRNHLSLSIMGGIAFRADAITTPYRYGVKTSHQVAFGGGINYHYNFNKDLSFITGLHMACPVRNLEYRIPKDAFNPPMSDDLFNNAGTAREAVFLVKIPATIEKRWFTNDKKYWNLGAGVSLVYTPLEGETLTATASYPNGQQVQYFYMSLQTNNNGKPWFNYHITGGHGIILKNYDLLVINLVGNLSRTKFLDGVYWFNVPGQPNVDGTYSAKGSYIGFSATYVRTGARLRKKQLKKG